MIPPELSSGAKFRVTSEAPVSLRLEQTPQHAASRPAEAETMAGGADPVWEVPRGQLAGPGRPHASYSVGLQSAGRCSAKR